jgi:hypothetical protein
MVLYDLQRRKDVEFFRLAFVIVRLKQNLKPKPSAFDIICNSVSPLLRNLPVFAVTAGCILIALMLQGSLLLQFPGLSLLIILAMFGSHLRRIYPGPR